jgi:hypothetical protein
MKYTFIDAHREEYQVQRMCRVLGVQRSGYYAWRKRGPSDREQANQALLLLIRAEHAASRKTYGSPPGCCTTRIRAASTPPPPTWPA